MPLQERKVFIVDPQADMTVREKSEELSARLATAPNVRRKIVRIERVEVGAKGWYIHYRVGNP